MPLRIPAKHISVLSKLLRLEENDRAGVFEALESLEADSLSLKRLSSNLALESYGFRSTESSALLEVISNLHNLHLFRLIDRESLIAEVVQAAEDELESAVNKDELPLLLERLLSIEQLEAFSKAINVTANHDRIFSRVRIFSDLRPVFGEDTDQLSGMALTHSLLLTTWGGFGGETETIEITMADFDLEELGDVVDRAKKKSASLKKILTNLEVNLFTLEEK